jgi:HEPN domain-containing protein
MPPETIPGSPSEWLRHAVSDLALAKLEPPPQVLLESLCFHAQQAAEKALKAVLVHKNVPPPRTHNLRTLLDLLTESTRLPAEIEDAAVLTDYAVMSRYPGDVEPVGQQEYSEALQLAEAVVAWAKKEIDA